MYTCCTNSLHMFMCVVKLKWIFTCYCPCSVIDSAEIEESATRRILMYDYKVMVPKKLNTSPTDLVFVSTHNAAANTTFPLWIPLLLEYFCMQCLNICYNLWHVTGLWVPIQVIIVLQRRIPNFYFGWYNIANCSHLVQCSFTSIYAYHS